MEIAERLPDRQERGNSIRIDFPQQVAGDWPAQSDKSGDRCCSLPGSPALDDQPQCDHRPGAPAFIQS